MTLREALLRWLAGELVNFLPPLAPKRPRVTLLREDNDMLIYAINLQPPGAPDVVSRELTEIIDSGTPSILTVVDGQERGYAQGANVELRLVDIDDQGNRSAPSASLLFIASDTIPPPAPGAVGVTLLREEP